MNLLVLNSRVDADHPTQAVTTRWLRALSEKFDRIFVVTVHMGRLSLPPNVKVYDLASPRFDHRVSRIFRLYSLTFRILLRHKIHGVFVHQAVVSASLTGFLFRFLRIPMLVWYCHRDVNLWLRISHLWADGVISSSRDSFRLPSRKFAVTGHGIDTEAFRPESMASHRNGPFVIGYIGRYSPIKRLEVLLGAVKILTARKDERLEVHLFGLSQNPMEQRYLEGICNTVRENELSGVVSLHGPVSNWCVPSVLHEFDVFVSQQETGGTDKAVLEAMSSGLPVIMATTTFNRLLPERIIRRLVFASGTPEEMAEKLEGLMGLDQEERTQVGMGLRKLVEQHHSLRRLALEISTFMEKRLDESP